MGILWKKGGFAPSNALSPPPPPTEHKIGGGGGCKPPHDVRFLRNPVPPPGGNRPLGTPLCVVLTEGVSGGGGGCRLVLSAACTLVHPHGGYIAGAANGKTRITGVRLPLPHTLAHPGAGVWPASPPSPWPLHSTWVSAAVAAAKALVSFFAFSISAPLLAYLRKEDRYAAASSDVQQTNSVNWNSEQSFWICQGQGMITSHGMATALPFPTHPNTRTVCVLQSPSRVRFHDYRLQRQNAWFVETVKQSSTAPEAWVQQGAARDKQRGAHIMNDAKESVRVRLYIEFRIMYTIHTEAHRNRPPAVRGRGTIPCRLP